jgi:hypothetical protein
MKWNKFDTVIDEARGFCGPDWEHPNKMYVGLPD